MKATPRERDQLLTDNATILLNIAARLPRAEPEHLEAMAEMIGLLAESLLCLREEALQPSERVRSHYAAIEKRASTEH